MGKYDPIAYTFDADYYCPGCTLKRFGECDGTCNPAYKGRTDSPNRCIACSGEHDNYPTPLDSEGNIPGAVAPWDEWWNPDSDECEALICADCGGCIDHAHRDDCKYRCFESSRGCDLDMRRHRRCN